MPLIIFFFLKRFFNTPLCQNSYRPEFPYCWSACNFIGGNGDKMPFSELVKPQMFQKVTAPPDVFYIRTHCRSAVFWPTCLGSI